MHTLVHRPASTMRDLPISLTRWITAASSQVFIEVRSSSAWPGNGAVTSSNIGPLKLFSATVVRMVETPKPAAALATRAALLRSVVASIECVAKAICDWKSIMISVWSFAFSSEAPGVAVATGLAVLAVVVMGVSKRGGRVKGELADQQE